MGDHPILVLLFCIIAVLACVRQVLGYYDGLHSAKRIIDCIIIGLIILGCIVVAI